MIRETTDIELTLRLCPQDMAKLHEEPRFALLRAGAPQQLESVYFDSKAGIVRAHGFVLRLDRLGGTWVQTLAYGPGHDGATPPEWRQELTSDQPDFAGLADTLLGPVLTDDVRPLLKPIFMTRVDRTSCELDTPEAAVLMAFSSGKIQAGSTAVPVSEIELRLKRGSPGELFKLAHDIGAIVPAEIEVKSWSERGYDLVGDRDATANKAGHPRLDAEIPAGQAFATIGRACLRHFLANQPGLLARDVESLHQARVALRRLRAAISLFADVVNDGKVDAIKAELRWIAQQVGPARDIDTLMIEALAPLRRKHAKEPGLASIARMFARLRLKRYREAREAVESSRFRKGVLDLAEWLEAGPWCVLQDPIALACRDMPVEALAARQLSRLRKKIRRRGADLDNLDPEALHRLRIQVKKTRYAVEFCFGIFHGKKADRRCKKLHASLAQLQDCLGGLNDIEMRNAMCRNALAHPAHGLTEEQKQSRAFAIGLILGDQQARSEHLLDGAQRAYARFDRAKRFWKRPERGAGPAPPATGAVGSPL